jgi:hypothetical protein
MLYSRQCHGNCRISNCADGIGGWCLHDKWLEWVKLARRGLSRQIRRDMHLIRLVADFFLKRPRGKTFEADAQAESILYDIGCRVSHLYSRSIGLAGRGLEDPYLPYRRGEYMGVSHVRGIGFFG